MAEELPMDMYEQIVETFLTVHERRAVIPQFPVLFDDQGEPWVEAKGRKIGWSLYPDFLAVGFGIHRGAQIIEVSKSMQTAKPRELVQRTLSCRDRVQRYVRWFAVDEGLQIEWRFFVRQRQAEFLKKELSGLDIQSDVTILEEVVDWVKNVMP
jgi:hypothetical protein